MAKFVSQKPITNGRMNRLEQKYKELFELSNLTGSLLGGDDSTQGSVGWFVRVSYEPIASIQLGRSADAMVLNVVWQNGDVSTFIEQLVKEDGFTYVV